MLTFSFSHQAMSCPHSSTRWYIHCALWTSACNQILKRQLSSISKAQH